MVPSLLLVSAFLALSDAQPTYCPATAVTTKAVAVVPGGTSLQCYLGFQAQEGNLKQSDDTSVIRAGSGPGQACYSVTLMCSEAVTCKTGGGLVCCPATYSSGSYIRVYGSVLLATTPTPSYTPPDGVATATSMAAFIASIPSSATNLAVCASGSNCNAPFSDTCAVSPRYGVLGCSGLPLAPTSATYDITCFSSVSPSGAYVFPPVMQTTASLGNRYCMTATHVCGALKATSATVPSSTEILSSQIDSLLCGASAPGTALRLYTDTSTTSFFYPFISTSAGINPAPLLTNSYPPSHPIRAAANDMSFCSTPNCNGPAPADACPQGTPVTVTYTFSTFPVNLLAAASYLTSATSSAAMATAFKGARDFLGGVQTVVPTLASITDSTGLAIYPYCSPGQYFNVGAHDPVNACVNCQPNSYSPGGATTACIPCNIGYTSSTKASQCTLKRALMGGVVEAEEKDARELAVGANLAGGVTVVFSLAGGTSSQLADIVALAATPSFISYFSLQLSDSHKIVDNVRVDTPNFKDFAGVGITYVYPPTAAPAPTVSSLAVGLGVGLGVGIPFLLILRLLFLWFRHTGSAAPPGETILPVPSLGGTSVAAPPATNLPSNVQLKILDTTQAAPPLPLPTTTILLAPPPFPVATAVSPSSQMYADLYSSTVSVSSPAAGAPRAPAPVASPRVDREAMLANMGIPARTFSTVGGQ